MKLEIPDELAAFAAVLEAELARLRGLHEATLTGGKLEYAQFEAEMARSSAAMREAALAAVRAAPEADPAPGPPLPEPPPVTRPRRAARSRRR